jgi:hypothetical protein|uniref:Uncharacterized protein n=1 Tax=viral metagenome TaxID=1070528 RepID=A0A6C0DL93_9ZZZZ
MQNNIPVDKDKDKCIAVMDKPQPKIIIQSILLFGSNMNKPPEELQK